MASASICAPPRAFSAPATPDPIQKWLFAALTTASVAWAAMSPSRTSIVSGGRVNAIKILSVPRQDVIGQREQRLALRAGRKGVQRLLRALGELHRAPVGEVDRGVLL